MSQAIDLSFVFFESIIFLEGWSSTTLLLLLCPSARAGHSLGGGTAAILAVMLKGSRRLSASARARVRAVCIGPAAVLSHRLSLGCRSFVVSIIFGLYTHTHTLWQ